MWGGNAHDARRSELRSAKNRGWRGGAAPPPRCSARVRVSAHAAEARARARIRESRLAQETRCARKDHRFVAPIGQRIFDPSESCGIPDEPRS